jgi:hypothetical protein
MKGVLQNKHTSDDKTELKYKRVPQKLETIYINI